MTLRRAVLGLLAPVSALAVALLVSSAALLLIDQSPVQAFTAMLQYGSRIDSILGSGTSSTRMSRRPCQVTAFIPVPPSRLPRLG